MASTKYLWLLHTRSYHLSMLQKYHFQWICHDYSRNCRLITYSLLGSSLRVLSPQSFYLKFLGQGIPYDHPPHLGFPYHAINMTLWGISVKSKLSPIYPEAIPPFSVWESTFCQPTSDGRECWSCSWTEIAPGSSTMCIIKKKVAEQDFSSVAL